VFVSSKNESFFLVIKTHQMQVQLHKSAPTTQKFRLGGKKRPHNKINNHHKHRSEKTKLQNQIRTHNPPNMSIKLLNWHKSNQIHSNHPKIRLWEAGTAGGTWEGKDARDKKKMGLGKRGRLCVGWVRDAYKLNVLHLFLA